MCEHSCQYSGAPCRACAVERGERRREDRRDNMMKELVKEVRALRVMINDLINYR